MAYEKQEWKDGKDGDTPITADRLNHIEDGIADKAKQGPKGDKGDTGDDGKDGSDGKKGSKGDKGDSGSDGSDGKDGRGIEDIERDGNTLIFKMTEGDDIEVDLPDDE